MVGGLKGTGIVVDPDGKLGELIPGIELVKRLRASLSWIGAAVLLKTSVSCK